LITNNRKVNNKACVKNRGSRGRGVKGAKENRWTRDDRYAWKKAGGKKPIKDNAKPKKQYFHHRWIPMDTDEN
jgi:hypothetical protein